MDCRTVTTCRVCHAPLTGVLSLGPQCLGGQFPGPGEPDPPAFPLDLCRCTAAACGLVQLGHTVNPERMFRHYGYRSGVTETMRRHLGLLAQEAVGLLGRPPERVLDVGGNDGTLLAALPNGHKASIDPSDVAEDHPGIHRVRGFFPQDLPPCAGGYDLVFSVACFYDADDPVAFAAAARDALAPHGLWCVEVASLWHAQASGAYDGVCHEHLLYFDPLTLRGTLRRAGLDVVSLSYNGCNGGSVRVYACRAGERKEVRDDAYPGGNVPPLEDFAAAAVRSARDIRDYLERCRDRGDVVHLLGASTKANTWLQQARVTPELVRAASDRDPRKAGRRTPGTGIPVVSEEASRLLRPDIYLVGPWHFRDEIVRREAAFLGRGGRLAFPLPRLEEVRD